MIAMVPGECVGDSFASVRLGVSLDLARLADCSMSLARTRRLLT